MMLASRYRIGFPSLSVERAARRWAGAAASQWATEDAAGKRQGRSMGRKRGDEKS